VAQIFIKFNEFDVFRNGTRSVLATWNDTAVYVFATGCANSVDVIRYSAVNFDYITRRISLVSSTLHLGLADSLRFRTWCDAPSDRTNLLRGPRSWMVCELMWSDLTRRLFTGIREQESSSLYWFNVLVDTVTCDSRDRRGVQISNFVDRVAADWQSDAVGYCFPSLKHRTRNKSKNIKFATFDRKIRASYVTFLKRTKHMQVSRQPRKAVKKQLL